MIKFSDLEKEWKKDPNFQKSYKSMEPEFLLAKAFIKARVEAKMSQAQVAKAMGTKQSAIARLESGESYPSIKTINKFAHAVGMKPEINFVPL